MGILAATAGEAQEVCSVETMTHESPLVAFLAPFFVGYDLYAYTGTGGGVGTSETFTVKAD